MIEREVELDDGRTLHFHEVRESRVDFTNNRIIVFTNSTVEEGSLDITTLFTVTTFTTWDPDLLNDLEDVIATEPLELYTEVPKVINETVDSLKAAKKVEINNRRDLLEKGGFPFMGKVIDSNLQSSLRIIYVGFSAMIAIQFSQPFSIDWTTADNSILTLDAPAALDMQAAFLTFAQELHDNATILKAQVDAITSTDLETVRAELALIPLEL